MKRTTRTAARGWQARMGGVCCALVWLSACGANDDEGSTGVGTGGSAAQSGGSAAQSAGKSSTGGSGNGQGSAGKPSGSAGSTPVTSDFPDAQEYVDAHNQVRAAVEAPAGYVGTWEPLPNVSWSDKVAATAQVWADHLRDTMDCGLEHDQDSGYGENLAAGTNVGASRAVELWAGEIDDYTYSAKYQFESNTGHYTQIVWRKSTSIGCASAQCGRSSVVVCRYDPPGNFIGGSIY